MAAALVFVDTNVFVYSLDQADPRKHAAARAWKAEMWRSRRGRTSFQVLQELYVTIATKQPRARAQVRAEVRDLLAWGPVGADAGVLESAWTVQDRYGLSFWDALIVAAARAAQCRYLLTEDLQPGQDLDGLIVVDPFRSEPGSLE